VRKRATERFTFSVVDPRSCNRLTRLWTPLTPSSLRSTSAVYSGTDHDTDIVCSLKLLLVLTGKLFYFVKRRGNRLQARCWAWQQLEHRIVWSFSCGRPVMHTRPRGPPTERRPLALSFSRSNLQQHSRINQLNYSSHNLANLSGPHTSYVRRRTAATQFLSNYRRLNCFIWD